MRLFTKLDVQLRWQIRRDLPEVLSIERESFEFPWTEDEFLVCLRKVNCIGMVAEDRKGEIVGYMIYEHLAGSLQVLNFAVAPWARHQGVGREMARKLVRKLSQQRRQRICLEVRESNLDAQLFFQRMGFSAVGVLRSRYEGTDEDAYRFVFELSECGESTLRPSKRSGL